MSDIHFHFYGDVPAPVAPDVLTDLREPLSQGKIIQAIRIVRDRTDCGLARAKNAVEVIGLLLFPDRYKMERVVGFDGTVSFQVRYVPSSR